MKELLIKLIQLKIQYLKLLITYHMNQTEASKRIYTVSKNLLYPQRDITPQDLADDDLACAESVSQVLKMCGVRGLPQGGIVSTIKLFEFLSSSEQFIKVDNPLPGDVIISVTGTGNGKLANGHCGIVGVVNIMNNHSDTGLWIASYTLEQWDKRYRVYGGMVSNFFRMI